MKTRASKRSVSKAELQRRLLAVNGSKVGKMLAGLWGSLKANRQLIAEGRVTMGVSPGELDRTLEEIMVVLEQIRDAYVEERDPRGKVKL